jgi:hypothetical protein
MQDSLLWYSRYCVWVGAIVLLVQSVTGRSVGPVTLMGVLLLAAGFIAFVGSLSWQGVAAATVDPSAEVPSAQEPASAADGSAASSVPGAEFTSSASQGGRAEARTPTAVPPESASEPSSLREDIASQRLTEDSPLVGASCAACGRRLEEGQDVTRCPECRAVQHTACWTDNGFSCATEGCSGRGALRAP